MKRLMITWGILAASAALTAADWPMWGGAPNRNMVSSMTGVPSQWDTKTGKNVKWMAKLGSQSYGNPVVANGVLYVATRSKLIAIVEKK